MEAGLQLDENQESFAKVDLTVERARTGGDEAAVEYNREQVE
jgi:hypothetical protein